MNLYISDLHLGHENVIRFDNRPFENLDEMHNNIITNWNRAVTKRDTVYILGDFCWGKTEQWLEFLPQLNGNKVLIRGNHDLKQYSAPIKKHFTDICDYKEISDNGKHLVLSHYAIPFHKAAYNPNCYMLFGHVHNTRENDFLDKLRTNLRTSHCEDGHAVGNFINVGCMMPWMDYTPRTIDEIIYGFEKYENDRLLKKYETNLPEFLQTDLDRYKQAQEDIQNGKEVSLIDCYYCELQSSINVCEVERIITPEHAWYLREKYLGLMREDILPENNFA